MGEGEKARSCFIVCLGLCAAWAVRELRYQGHMKVFRVRVRVQVRLELRSSELGARALDIQQVPAARDQQNCCQLANERTDGRTGRISAARIRRRPRKLSFPSGPSWRIIRERADPVRLTLIRFLGRGLASSIRFAGLARCARS